MKINKENLKVGFWYEDEAGNKIESDENLVDRPQGARSRQTIHPTQLDETIYMFYDKDKKCNHRRTKKMTGLEDQYKGRKCLDCGRSQIKIKWRPWPRKWDEGETSYELMTWHTHLCTLSEECAVTMVNAGDYTLREALAIMAQSCERCGNVLIYRYLDGKDGYEEFSEEWYKSGTSCDFCKGLEKKGERTWHR